MKRWLVALSALALLPVGAAAADPSDDGHTVVAPVRNAVFAPVEGRWADAGPAGKYYPDRAFRYGVGGFAFIRCSLSAAGLLNGCSIQAEEPADEDFGYAALALARNHVITVPPRIVDGRPVDGEWVLVQVPFHLVSPPNWR